MSLIRWEPLEAVDQFFSDHPLKLPKLGWDLAIDVYEDKKKKNVIAKMSLPGIKPEDLDISVDEETLTISGMREEEKETDTKEYYSKEIRRGSFSRTVVLPKRVDATKVDAKYSDGVLTITMPALGPKKGGVVQVKVKK